jgi:alcohol dehydrogenase class IV
MAEEMKKNVINEPVIIQFPGTKVNGKLMMGMNVADKIGQELAGLSPLRGEVLLIVDPVLYSMKLHKGIVESLNKAGILSDLFYEIEPEPSVQTVKKLEEKIANTAYGAVIGMGGGSSLDMAKLAAIRCFIKKDINCIVDHPEVITGRLPLILCPTTSGTGSEVSPYIVLDNGSKKRFISSPHVYADIALVDPMLTVSMPPRITASTGLDALTHAVEGVTGKDNPYTRAFARECVRLVFSWLPEVVKDGSSMEGRYYMSFASVLGMLAYSQGGGLYAHSMSYILTISHKIPHGTGCGLALPYTLKFNEPFINEILMDFAGVMGGMSNTQDVINAFFTLTESVGLPVNLSDAGIEEEELAGFAQSLVKDYYRARNPRALDIVHASSLVQAMFDQNLHLIP